MARPPPYLLVLLMLAISRGLEGGVTAVTTTTTTTDPSPSTTADSLRTSTAVSFRTFSGDSLDTSSGDSLDTSSGDFLDASSGDDSLDTSTGDFLDTSSGDDSLDTSTDDFLDASTVDSLSISTADSLSTSTVDSLSISTADSLHTSTADFLGTSTADSLHTSTADFLGTSTADSLHISTADSFRTSTADFLSTSTADSLSTSTDSLSTSTADFLSTSTADSLSTSAADSLSTSAADSLHTTTADSLHTTTADSLPTTTADSLHTTTADSFHTSTGNPFPQTSTHKIYTPDLSSKSSLISSNDTPLTTERNKRDGQSISEEIDFTINMMTDGDEIQVSWDDLNCTDRWEIKWTCERNYNCCSDPCNNSPSKTLQDSSTSFIGEPCTTYEVQVTGKNCNSSNLISKMDSISINCTAPTKPRNLMVTKPAFNESLEKSRMAYVTWSVPYPTNGILKNYRLTIYHNKIRTPIINIPVENCSKNECSYSRQLKPESSYGFEVQAENKEPSSEFSSAEIFNLTTEAGMPFFTSNRPLSFENDEVSYNSITLLINGSSFSNANGKIIKCLVKMKKGCDDNVKNEPDRIVYCTKKPPSATKKVVIGEENPTPSDCDGYSTLNSLDSKECYKFYILIYTKKESNQSIIVHITTKQHPLIPVIYGLLVLFTILLVGMVAAYVIFRRQYRPIQHSESIELPLVVPSPPDVSVEKRILLSDLLPTVQSLFSDGSAGLAREYAEIQALRTLKPCKNAQLPVNKAKSRYLNILPFDETRVVLKEYPNVTGSNFINASYVHGYSIAREFIACQGPLNNTVGDFWRMVWEKDVHVIVMVTQCMERNKEKCCKYWPDKDKSFSFGDLTLKVRNLQELEHQTDGFIQRTLQLSKRHKVRSIHHFHFITWPDMGCPDNPDKLIKFVKVVKQATPAESAHVVVHCSAGVGRTGTFIGLSNLIEEMNEQESIDVFHTVYRMRLHRTNMVQTQVQYAFLYKCVLKYYLDEKGESESWSTIERLDNPETIPDVINGALRGPQHDEYDEGDIICNTSKENITH